MNNYEDSNGQFHAKPVTESDPIPTNDGFIHTAYAKKIGLVVWPSKLLNLFKSCLKDGRLVKRLPDKIEPPPSRDVILGCFYLNLMNFSNLDGWSFSPYPIPPFSPLKLITQALALLIVQPYYKRILGIDIKLYSLGLAHRNFFWKNKLDQIYRFAFNVPPQDRYSILKWSDRFKWYLPSHLLYATISMFDRLCKPSGIRWLKYGGDKNLEAMVKEFPSNHPVNQRVRLEL